MTKMESLLEKLPVDEQREVDHQIYYDPEKGATAEWGAVECWVKKDGTMQGAIFNDSDIEPVQEFDHAGHFDGDLAEFVRTDLIDEGRLTKLREGVDHYIVVNAPDDGGIHDTFAVRFDSLEDAEKYRDTEESSFRERELLTENEFLTEWTKPAEAYSSEEEAAEDGYVWFDEYGRWLEIPIKNA